MVLLPLAMEGIEEDCRQLYRKPDQPTGQMIPLLQVRWQGFKVKDSIPDNAEI